MRKHDHGIEICYRPGVVTANGGKVKRKSRFVKERGCIEGFGYSGRERGRRMARVSRPTYLLGVGAILFVDVIERMDA